MSQQAKRFVSVVKPVAEVLGGENTFSGDVALAAASMEWNKALSTREGTNVSPSRGKTMCV
jgi:hypothetical protein